MKPRAPSAPASSAGPPGRLRPHLAQLASLIIVFAIGYSLGMLSSSIRPSPKPSQTVLVRPRVTTDVPESNGTGTRYPAHDLFRFREECGEPIPSDAVLPTLLEKLFDGESPYARFPPPHVAPLLRPAAARPRGWGSTGAVFAELIGAVRPDTVVELGAFLGASALHMAAAARNLSLSPTILCVDDFRGWPGFRARFRRDVPPPRHGDALLLPQFMANVAAAGGEGTRVLPLPFSTASALAALCEWGVRADLVEVDAGHDFHSAWADINLAWAVLRPGGVMFGHDYFTAADHRGVPSRSSPRSRGSPSRPTASIGCSRRSRRASECLSLSSTAASDLCPALRCTGHHSRPRTGWCRRAETKAASDEKGHVAL